MGWPWSKPKPDFRKLRTPVQRHLRINLAEAHCVSHEIKPVQRLNIQRVLDDWTAKSKPAVLGFGYTASGYFADDSLVRYLINDELIQAPIERVQLESSPSETVDCITIRPFLCGPVDFMRRRR